MISRTAILLYILTASIFLTASTAHAEEHIFVPTEYDAGVLEEGTSVNMDIILRNITRRHLRIVSVETSCGCTEAAVMRGEIEPGGYGSVRLTMDTTGKIGRFAMSIEVLTDASDEPFILTVRGEVRHSGDGPVDAGVIFRGKCRRCHLGGNIESKRGEILYNAACYVCHKEASSLKGSSVETLLRAISGGVKGTSMPGFSKSEGGPLTEEQIDSLVEFLRE